MIKTNQTVLESFWKTLENNEKQQSQLQRYVAKNAPECIRKFIAIGGGPLMGTTLEKFARHQFHSLKKRMPGKGQTGYDHIFQQNPGEILFIEQKSSGHWGDHDFRWQHVEEKHKWDWLLLCGIGYHEIHFWLMNRTTFHQLIGEGKITNQGNKSSDSSEGKWFNYLSVKDALIEVHNDEDLKFHLQKFDTNDPDDPDDPDDLEEAFKTQLCLTTEDVTANEHANDKNDTNNHVTTEETVVMKRITKAKAKAKAKAK